MSSGERIMKEIKEGHKNLAFEKDDQDNIARRWFIISFSMQIKH